MLHMLINLPCIFREHEIFEVKDKKRTNEISIPAASEKTKKIITGRARRV